MQHIFDVDIAERYGMLEAILLNHFQFWDAKNRANGNGYHDGYYWTYNSAKAFRMLFPYASEYQIRKALKHLQDEDLILVGNYNKSSYDRTMWYALSKSAMSILQKPKMEESKNKNGNDKCQRPIPDNNTDINTDIDYIVKQYNDICVSMPKCMKLTGSRRKKIRSRLSDNSKDDIIFAFRKAEESDFLSGRSGVWQNCNIDWFFKNDDNIAKVLEGKYDNKVDTLKQVYMKLEKEKQDAGISNNF